MSEKRKKDEKEKKNRLIEFQFKLFPPRPFGEEKTFRWPFLNVYMAESGTKS